MANADPEAKFIISANIFKVFCFTKEFSINTGGSGFQDINDFDLIQFAGNIVDGKWTQIAFEREQGGWILRWDKEDEAVKGIIHAYAENGFNICPERGIYQQEGDDILSWSERLVISRN